MSEREELLSMLRSEIERVASEAGWSCTIGDEGPWRDRMDLLASMQGESSGGFTLPTPRTELRLTPHNCIVLLTVLRPDAVRDSLNAAIRWASLARSHLPPAARTDLHLFLVLPQQGPPSSSRWDAVKSEVEADIRYCRKLVWTPSATPSVEEVRGFIDRTFLASPWKGTAAVPLRLDPLANIVTARQDARLSKSEREAWLDHLGAIGAPSGAQLAERLVDALEEPDD